MLEQDLTYDTGNTLDIIMSALDAEWLRKEEADADQEANESDATDAGQ
jgi:hypothetical protein